MTKHRNEIPPDYRGEKLRLGQTPEKGVWLAVGTSAAGNQVRIWALANDREAAKLAVKARLYVHQTPRWYR